MISSHVPVSPWVDAWMEFLSRMPGVIVIANYMIGGPQPGRQPLARQPQQQPRKRPFSQA
jgi:hypothetical protein